jgi:O-antigen ligase
VNEREEEFVAIAENNSVTVEAAGNRTGFRVSDPTKGAFFWLTGFFIVYCARPEDYVPGLKFLPLAKITAVFAIWGLFTAIGRTKRKLRDLPKEAKLLLILIGLLFVGAFLSPVWRGGAVRRTMDFSKIYVAWVLVFLVITSFDRLRSIIFIQVSSVIVACAAAVIKGHNAPRLEAVLGGIYSNPNDLAFAIVLSLPFALAFMVTSRSTFLKLGWIAGMLVMMVTLFLTASRAGFIDLLISGAVTLYYFGIKGKRTYLIFATGILTVVIMATAGGKLYNRFAAISGDSDTEQSAYGSYEDRKYLMFRALDCIEHYPVLGIGVRNFPTYSLIWHDVHMTYLQICAEGGIPALILFLMFFRRAFVNLKSLRKRTDLDPDIVLFVGALTSSLVGFVVGALFAPEAYQYFPYFAVAFTAALLQTIKENDQNPGSVNLPSKKPRHFLETYADYGRTGAVTPVR